MVKKVPYYSKFLYNSRFCSVLKIGVAYSMIFRRISTFFIIIFNFAFSLERFPPLNIPPTYSNAKANNLVNYFKNESNEVDFIPIRSDFRNLNQNRNELSSSDVAHLLRRTTFGPTLE